MVFTPVFWNKKKAKIQDIQQQTAAQRPKIKPKIQVPKPQYRISRIIGYLVVRSSQRVSCHIAVSRSARVRAPITIQTQAPISSLLATKQESSAKADQRILSNYPAIAYLRIIAEHRIEGEISCRAINSAKAEPVLTIDEMLDILNLFDEID